MFREDGKMAVTDAATWKRVQRRQWLKGLPPRALAALGRFLRFVFLPIGLFMAGIWVIVLHILFIVASIVAAPTVHCMVTRKVYRYTAVITEILGYGLVIAGLTPLVKGVPPLIEGYELYAVGAAFGLLATNGVSGICELGRRMFRFASARRNDVSVPRVGVYPICVDYAKPILKLVTAGRYDEVDELITEAFCGKQACNDRAEMANKDVELFHYAKSMTSDAVLADIRNHGYRPATLRELLVFAVKYAGEQLKYPIVAFGSIVQRVDKNAFVPYANGEGGKRGLRLRVFAGGWDGRCRFAVVRKS